MNYKNVSWVPQISVTVTVLICYNLIQNLVALNNKNYHFCLTVLWVRNLDRAEHRGHVSTPQDPGTQLEDSKAGGWNPLKTNLLTCLVVDDISAERLAENLGWNTHVCPPNMAWASSQYSSWMSPEKAGAVCQNFNDQASTLHAATYAGPHYLVLSQAPFQIQGKGTDIDPVSPWDLCGSH